MVMPTAGTSGKERILSPARWKAVDTYIEGTNGLHVEPYLYDHDDPALRPDSYYIGLLNKLVALQDPSGQGLRHKLLFGEWSKDKEGRIIPTVTIRELKRNENSILLPDEEKGLPFQYYQQKLGLATPPVIQYFYRQAARVNGNSQRETDPVRKRAMLARVLFLESQAEILLKHSAPPVLIPEDIFPHMERWLAYDLSQHTAQQDPITNIKNAGRLLNSAVLWLPAS